MNLDVILYQVWHFAIQVVFLRYFYDINHFFNSEISPQSLEVQREG